MGNLFNFPDTGKKGFSGDGKQVSHGVYNGMHNLAWSSDDLLYLSDTHNHLVRKIDLKTKLILFEVNKGQKSKVATLDLFTKEAEEQSFDEMLKKIK